MIQIIKEKITKLRALENSITLDIENWYANEKIMPHFMIRDRQYIRGQIDAYRHALQALGL